MFSVFEFIIYFYSIVYIVILALIASGQRRVHSKELPSKLPYVSVVVCARNEEALIRKCLDSLSSLDYPLERLEIILVDDESEDNTLEILREYAKYDGRFTVLSAFGAPRDLPAKQRPLNLGIEHTKGEIVLVTDADCAIPPGWIKSHIKAYDEKIGIVGGITKISTEYGRLFDKLQNCDQVSKLAVAMGCAGLGLPITVMGNNFSFRRNVYKACGGFKKIKPSIVEDMVLMNAITHDTGYRLGWARGENSVAVTAPERSFRTFIQQRVRWVHEMGDLSWIGKLMIGIESLMTVVFGMSLIIAIWNFWPVAVCTGAWFFGYVLTMLPTPGTGWKDYPAIPGMIVFQMFYGIVLGIHSISGQKKVIWKGRLYEKEMPEKPAPIPQSEKIIHW